MEKKYLKKLQSTEIEILNYFDNICKKNKLKYFIMYGTLLGAVRHKGFIPWDDDIDVGMLREDYDKLIKILEQERNDKFKLDYFNMNKDYYLPFAKIKNIKTLFEEKNSVNYKGNKGIWIDIFPFDNISSNEVKKRNIIKGKFIILLHEVMVRRTLRLKTTKFINFISNFITNTQCIRLINKIMKNDNDSCEHIFRYSCDGLDNSFILKKEDIFPLTKIEFNGKRYYAPKNYKNILTQLYGLDYMELPPVEKRITHNPNKIVFEDGEEIKFNNN